ncbi:GDP-L-fucose synthase family protein [Campylobacter hyointestinalis]|uniref:GDP-L-fucose synthase family protein n=1 Tax=Campylobacter hyointestinalis TaxID=198 RepID=UPI000DCF1442|nr:GDP-L-fucose synthase [Campylobacter hyointestinalis]RAZ62463.1 GDP-L-fucose synthase [Campylobacter hyointestinalis subsp. lawsonii]
MEKNSKIYIAGHRGLVGSAILQKLQNDGYLNLIYKTHDELDLTNQQEVKKFFEIEKPEFVILCAAKAGGIGANSKYRADFIYQNLMIECNVIHQAYLSGVKKLLFIASTTVYPKNATLPTNESWMLKGDLDYANKPYALSKIAGCLMCESYNLQYNTNFISITPTNLYGNNDKFDLEKSHVVPGILRKMHLAKLLNENRYDELLNDLNMPNLDEALVYLNKFGINENSVEIWGDGTPTREFLHSDDLAEAALFIMKKINFKDLIDNSKEIQNTHLNIGPNKNITIKELATLIKEIVGFKGDLTFNANRPNGAINKLTDCSKIHSLGWKHKINLEEGVKMLYQWYKNGGGYELNLKSINNSKFTHLYSNCNFTMPFGLGLKAA